MPLGLGEFSAVKVKPGNVEMPDRLLRQLLRFAFFPKDASEPAKGLAKVAAEPGRESEVVHNEAAVVAISLLFGEFEGETELLFRLGPLALGDQT